MINRIALVGSASTGKTTVFELLRNSLPSHYQFINESTRTVQKYDFPINLNGTNSTQLAISSFHLEALIHPFNAVYDRCYLDLLVYTRGLTEITPNVKAFIENTWKRVKSNYSHFVYFPIEFDAVDDGIRSTDEEWRKRIDIEFKTELNRIPEHKKLTVTGSPMQRVNQILKFIENE